MQKTPLSSVCNIIKINISHVNLDFLTVIVLVFFFLKPSIKHSWHFNFWVMEIELLQLSQF